MMPVFTKLKLFCNQYGLCEGTVRRGLKVHPHKYPPVYRVGGLLMFKTAEIQEWIDLL